VKERLTLLFAKHRKRLAGLVLAIFVAVVAIDVGSNVPRATSLALDVGDDHAHVREVEITYVEGEHEGPVVRTARRRYEEGAPSRISDAIDLVPGVYRVQLTLTRDDGTTERREGRFVAPGEGTIAVSWAGR
jgi:hypothetical protein